MNRWITEPEKGVSAADNVTSLSEILFICHTIVVIMLQTLAIITLGSIPYAKNRLIKTIKEAEKD